MVTNEKMWFCNLATQYYIAARLAARAQLLPVHGNLFHHAIEMYLKAGLVDGLPLSKLKTLRHGLANLWDVFKSKTGDPSLARFDSTVRELDKFEAVRYPDNIIASGMTTSIVWGPQERASVQMVAGAAHPTYEFVISEVDDLVACLLRLISLKPKAFLPGEEAREAVLYRNQQAATWT